MRLINPAGPWGARRRLREALGPDEQLSVQSGVLIDDAWTSAHSVTEDTLYGSSDNSDSPAYTRAAAGGAVTSYIGACVDTAGTATWEIRDGHGDIVGAIDTNATYTASPPVDEFGVGAPPARRLGYLGGAERFTTDTTLGIIRMGVRLYDPTLGRFLQTDPNRGGSANNYDYANQNPINDLDLGGNRSFFCSEDFCDAEHARMQIGNPDSPLNRSETFTVNSCCGYERPLHSERMYSMAHQYIRSFSDEAEIFGGVAAGLGIGFAAVGT
ncbi:MAG: RHS repeat-associated core domain-containing protein, partial [Pseudonocardiaceae bacterium]